MKIPTIQQNIRCSHSLLHPIPHISFPLPLLRPPRCHPPHFVYTQCQDTPTARIRYSVRLNIPAGRDVRPARGEAPRGTRLGRVRGGRGRREVRRPPYLFSFAVGELVSGEVGPRTRIYAEDDAGLLEREFVGRERMIREGGEAVRGLRVGTVRPAGLAAELPLRGD